MLTRSEISVPRASERTTKVSHHFAFRGVGCGDGLQRVVDARVRGRDLGCDRGAYAGVASRCCGAGTSGVVAEIGRVELA